jgi:glycosyltransferase involved in cell wall biosynthesis
VPNGLPDHHDVERLPWADRDRGLLVVGRVEPRKRQLDIAKAASELGVRTTFVGELTRSAPRYADDFCRVLDGSVSLSYMGRLAPNEVVRLMGRHRVLLNMSWVEVQSLVDLEASAMGCHVVASSAGHSAEWLPHHVTTVDRFDVVGAVRQALDLSLLDVEPPPFEYQFSWEDAARRLLHTYSALEA